MNKTVGARVAVVFMLTEMIKQNELDTGNLFKFIKNIIKIVDETNKASKIKLSSTEKHDVVMSIILDVAKGKDGILGTSDDLIPPHIIEEIHAMKNTSLLSDCIALTREVLDKKKCNIPKCIFCVSKLWI